MEECGNISMGIDSLRREEEIVVQCWSGGEVQWEE